MSNILNVGQGGPVNTQDVLEQLRKMRDDLKSEQQENNVAEEDLKFEHNEEQEEKIEVENLRIEENKKIEAVETNEEQIEQLEQVEEKQTEETNVQEINEVQEEKEESQKESFDQMYQKLFGKAPISKEYNEEEKTYKTIDLLKENISVFETQENSKPNYKFIGIVFNTYIIIEIDKEMYIMDQHAAHERIMYEKVKKNYYSDRSKDCQMLLLPDIITLTHKEMDIAKENIEMFEKAGFALEEFGENTIKLTGVPTICLDIDNKQLLVKRL